MVKRNWVEIYTKVLLYLNIRLSHQALSLRISLPSNEYKGTLVFILPSESPNSDSQLLNSTWSCGEQHQNNIDPCPSKGEIKWLSSLLSLLTCPIQQLKWGKRGKRAKTLQSTRAPERSCEQNKRNLLTKHQSKKKKHTKKCITKLIHLNVLAWGSTSVVWNRNYTEHEYFL